MTGVLVPHGPARPSHGPARPLGATAHGDGTTSFVVWAPRARRVEVVLDADDARRSVPLTRDGAGYHLGDAADVPPGTRYRYRLHGDEGAAVERPDPASRWQPDGVEGPSAVDDSAFGWTDEGFVAPPLHQQVLYEVHVGTFTDEGTFDAAIAHLDDLADLGVTTLELLPVAQFPGPRNWGYDGVLPYAVQDSYGGPEGLRRLVDAAHARGLGVVLDVVYNHLGPQGNHLADFGPYFTSRTATPWGDALNTDGPGSDGVRRFVVDNAVRWVEEFHLDGLRLDAVHAILDQSATHLLEELTTAVHAAARAAGRSVHVIAESDLADARLLRPPEAGGLGLDGQWADDFHHAVHVALTGEQDGYYADYRGLVDLPRLFRDRYVYAGRYSPARDRTVGRPAPDVAYDRFVACVQNHDQVGNRARGERLTHLVDHEARKLAAAALLTSPLVPLLFMGEEYAAPSPFLYFTSHTDPGLAEAVTAGRRREFAAFTSFTEEVPDPQDVATFERSRLDRTVRGRGEHAGLERLYRDLLRLRREEPLITEPTAPDVEATPVPGREAVVLRRERAGRRLMILLNAEATPTAITVADSRGPWTRLLDTTAAVYDAGPRPGGTDTPTTPATIHPDDDALTVTVPARSALVLRQESP